MITVQDVHIMFWDCGNACVNDQIEQLNSYLTILSIKEIDIQYNTIYIVVCTYVTMLQSFHNQKSNGQPT